MIRRFSFLALSLLAVSAVAHTEQTLSQAEPALVARSREHASVALKCTAKSGYKYDSVDAKVELGSMLITTAAGVKSSIIKLSKESNPVDSRCGATALPLEANLNYEITAPHKWGQTILQLPKDYVDQKGAFDANLHDCDYDGDWSASRDAALTCTVSSK